MHCLLNRSLPILALLLLLHQSTLTNSAKPSSLLPLHSARPSRSCVLPPSHIPNYTTHYYNQFVDHQNFYTSDTFNQRYLVWADCWASPKNPILFYTGNEGDITSFWDNTGFIFELGYQFKALVIFGEHRYYGESLPYGAQSWDREKVGYLSTGQALADYATLITHLKIQYDSPQAPVLAFGGSYGGMLSAWFRITYPHVVVGSLAASAPLGVVGGLTGEGYKPAYFEVITADYALYDPRCPDIVRDAYLRIQKLSQSPDGLAEITQKMQLCKDLKVEDVEQLILWTENAFGSLAMINYPYPTNFLGPVPGFPVNVSCQLLLSQQDNSTFPSQIDSIQNLALAVGLFYNGSGANLSCFDIYAEFIFCADQTGCGTGPAGTSWDYQACTEAIFYPNTNGITDMFPPRNWTSTNLTEYCKKTWGIETREDWIQIEYGGENLKGSSNIIFSNGNFDPWQGGGIRHNISDSLIAIFIEGGAHHLDLRSSNPADPHSVIEARATEAAYLEKWAAEALGLKVGEMDVLHDMSFPWSHLWWVKRSNWY